MFNVGLAGTVVVELPQVKELLSVVALVGLHVVVTREEVEQLGMTPPKVGK